MARRSADARWQGGIQSGDGTIALESGAFEGKYSFQSRFEEGPGTNPEEMLAGSHAGCFTMALTLALERAGHNPEGIDTTATAQLLKDDGGFAIKRIDLRTRARVPGISNDEFQELAKQAKENCPISKALASVETIELEAQLEG
jgi:osmotically inducible protein OsmC